MQGELLAFDLETTGLDPDRDEIIEIGIARFRDGSLVDEYSSLVKPQARISSDISHLTGIHNEDVADKPRIEQLLPELRAYFGTARVVAHNAAFDLAFLRKYGLPQGNPQACTYELASMLLPQAASYSLTSLARHLDIELANAHRALDDARATGRLYWKLWQKLCHLPPNLLTEILQASEHLAWSARDLLQAALQSSLRAQRPWRRLLPFEPLAKPPPLELHEAKREPLPLSRLDALFAEGGALARQHPRYEARPQQLAMASELATALNKGEQLIIEAGTGTGKSLAYLLPAALWALQNGQRVTVSTHTIPLQEQLLKQELPLVQALVGKGLRAALMKGRGNYLCPRRLELARRRRTASLDELLALAKILVWLQESDSGDRKEITLRGGDWALWTRISAQDEGCNATTCSTMMAGICPFHQARQQAEAAHILVTNHALLLADAQVDFRALPNYHNLVVDEAHHLEDAITQGMSRRIEQRQVLANLRGLIDKGDLLDDFSRRAQHKLKQEDGLRLQAFLSDIAGAARTMRRYFRSTFDAWRQFAIAGKSDNRYAVRLLPAHRDSSRFAPVQSAWDQLAPYLLATVEALEKLCSALPHYAKFDIPAFDESSAEIHSLWRYLAELQELLQQFTVEPQPNTVYSLTPGTQRDSLQLQAFPLDIGPQMDEMLSQRLESVVLTGATLRTQETFEHLQRRLHAESYRTVALGSPYDYRRATLLYLPSDMPEPNKRKAYTKMVERGIIALTTALDGRVMALFTSYAQLREISKAVTPRLKLGGIAVYDQSFGGSRDLLLENFRRADKALLMGTRSFWEGVDIPGAALSAVVIVKLPFAVPSDPVFAARAETYDNSFQDYAVPDAILRFRQGFGRLIRSGSDRGIVTVFDSRVIHKSYGASFLESLPECTVKFGALDKLPEHARHWLEQKT